MENGSHIVRRPGDVGSFTCSQCGSENLALRLMADDAVVGTASIPIVAAGVVCRSCGNSQDFAVGGGAYDVVGIPKEVTDGGSS